MNLISWLYSGALFITITLTTIVATSWQQVWLVLPCSLVLNWLYEHKEVNQPGNHLVYTLAGSAVFSGLMMSAAL